MGWTPARWPLRVRVALAFLASTVVALAGLGVFVHVRMGEALDERLRDTITVEADRLAALPAPGPVGGGARPRRRRSRPGAHV